MYDIVNKGDHYEVYIDGSFYCFASSLSYAAHVVDTHIHQRLKEETCNGNTLRGR